MTRGGRSFFLPAETIKERSLMRHFANRVIRAVKLDPTLYEEVEHDKTAMGQAIGVIVLSSLAAGIGTLEMGLKGMWINAIGAIIAWYIWAYLTYFIGTRFIAEPQTEADHGQLLRTLGFASAPGLLRVLGIVPGIREFVFSLTSIWMLVAMVIAVRQALDYTSTLRAVGVCFLGWIVQAIILLGIYVFIRGAA